MTGQQWRKALWHLRHGGIAGFRDYKRKSKFTDDSSDDSVEAEWASRGEDRPSLSIVVPTFNASDFIEKCLNSILAQKGIDLEVLLVDDGSNDDTVAKARQVAELDGRVTVITGRNSGPAIARNRGVEAARGEYLAFVDADDEVLPNAYATMVGSLERTGSDIATGSYIRIGTMGRSRPNLTTRVHTRQRLAVRLDDMPELLEEPVLWNKIYRRDFWNRHVGEMASFANYEDQEPVYRALVGAAAIDVLTTDVYAWRLAEGRDTRSRRKAKLTDLYAKLEVIEALNASLEKESDDVREHAQAIWVGTDLAMHAEYLDTASKRYRKILCSATNHLKKTMARGAWKLVPAQTRLFMWVVATGKLEDIEEILGTRAEESNAMPLEYSEDHWSVAPTYISRLKTRLPSWLLKVQAVDLKPVAVVRNARWVGERKIEMQGCAYIPGVEPVEVTVRLRGMMDGATVFDLPVESMNDNRIDLELGDPWRSYAATGFRACIDLSEIDDVSPRGIEILGLFQLQEYRLLVPATSTAVVGMVAPSPAACFERITVVADDHDELSIRPVTMPFSPVLAKNVEISGDHISLTVSAHADIHAIELSYRGGTLPMDIQGPSIFHAALPELPAEYSAGGERIWTVSARMKDGSSQDVYYEAVDYLLPETGRVRPEPNAEGKVVFTQRSMRVSITGASNDRDRLLLSGRIDPPQKISVVLKSSAQTIVPLETTLHADGGFTAIYELTTIGPEGGTVAALSGGYHVRYGATPETADKWARVAGKLAIRPVDCFTEWNTLRLEGRGSGAVGIAASPPWSPQERTRYGRFALRRRDWGPLSNSILFESYNGKSTNDNPRAIFDQIHWLRKDLPMYWSVRDRTVEIPEGAIPVVEGTAAWNRALATSRVWVNNNNFPYYVQKKPEQFYLQTWHGTPIKKLLWDIKRRKVPLTYRRLMETEVPTWDLLLAQGRTAEENLRSGLGYNGDVWSMEYPRNSRLRCDHERLSAVRERLGVPLGKKSILYAPTWRNGHRSAARIEWTELLALEALAKSTDAYLLFRSHHISRRVAPSTGERLIDVSAEPHVEDIMAIADLLITDYSSIVYDFMRTRKPAVVYTPDVSAYKSERGIYENALLELSGSIVDNWTELSYKAHSILSTSPIDVGVEREPDDLSYLVQLLINKIEHSSDSREKVLP